MNEKLLDAEFVKKAHSLIDKRLAAFTEENSAFKDADEMQDKVSEFANKLMVDLELNVADTFEQVYWAEPLGETIYFGKYDIAYTDDKSKIVWRKENFKEALLKHMGL